MVANRIVLEGLVMSGTPTMHAPNRKATQNYPEIPPKIQLWPEGERFILSGNFTDFVSQENENENN